MSVSFFGAVPPKALALTSYERAEMGKLQHWLPEFSCKDHKALKNCILWTTDSCILQVEKSLDYCMRKHDRQMDLPGPSLTTWKARIIQCTENDVRLLMQSQLRQTQDCLNKGNAPARLPSSFYGLPRCEPASPSPLEQIEWLGAK